MGLPTLKYRRLRGDIIEFFKKITKHKYDYKVAPGLIYNINKVTRRNDFKLSKMEVIMILGNFRSLIELLIFVFEQSSFNHGKSEFNTPTLE